MPKMKAAIVTKYGPPDVIKIREVDKPIPEEDEVLIKLYATTVTSGDVRIRSLDIPAYLSLFFRLFMGFKGPKQKILGVEFAGEVEKTGENVKNFKVGDKVFGSSFSGSGTYAEYCCIKENDVITTIPSNFSYQEAAPIFFGSHTALYFLKKGNLSEGKKVLFYGASGCVGTYAVQIAKYFGAEVTGVCSTSNLELVRSLGADYVIDYTEEDFNRINNQYDIIFDTVGKSDFSGCLKSLKNNGIYLRAVHLAISDIVRGIWTNLTTSRKVIGGIAKITKKDTLLIKELCEKGKIKAVIDKTYTLDEIVEAHRYVEKGHKKGNVIIQIYEDQ